MPVLDCRRRKLIPICVNPRVLNRKTADQVFGLINMIVIILHVWGPADKLSSCSSTADKLEMDIDLFCTKIEPRTKY